MMLKRVISGGQTGADIGGLYAAKRCGIRTGGSAPQKFMTEDGEKRELLEKEFGLLEIPKPGYKARTVMNIKDSDATIIIGHLTGGSKITAEKCEQHKRPFLVIDPQELEDPMITRQAVLFMREHQPKVLNIAGNRESKCPGLQASVEIFLSKVFNLL